MKSQFKPLILVGVLLCGLPLTGARAQETLGGLGAAGAMGATLGAAGAGSVSSGRATRGVNGSSSADGTSDMSGGDPRSGGSGSSSDSRGASGAGAAKPVSTLPIPQTFTGSGADYVRELMSSGPARVPAPDSRRRSPRAQARYAAQVARQSKKQRSKAVQSKYKIPGVGFEAAYLPQDRYKFGKVWRFVSTEDDRFYYTPSGMARKRFNPNRVIGFNSFQEALAAGYRPDPVSKPAPGAQIAYLARLYRGPELYTFVEYAYAGQMSPEAIFGAYNYARSVEQSLRPTRAAPFIGSTVAKILEATLTGDDSIIPREFNSNGPIVRQTVTTTTTRGSSNRGGSSGGGSSGGSGSSSSDSGGGDRRTDDFNNFSNRAGGLANVPGNR